MQLRSIHVWVISFVLVALAAAYQRVTGPTFPVFGHFEIGGNRIGFSLPRSSDSPGDAEVKIPAPDTRIGGIIETKRVPSDDPWTRHDLVRQGDDLLGMIPHQPPAGKVMYRIYLFGGLESNWLTQEPVVLRFKGVVPEVIMIPHIALMFLAMLLSTRAGFEALLKRSGAFQMTLWTTIALGIGGLILGPLVQKLAFGAYWTGWPLGRDLTDNKTVASFLLWAVALWRLHQKKQARGWVLAASIFLFVIYLVPHSLLGSELDYTQTALPGK